MATAVEVPKLGNSVEECLISKWVKRKGDAVSAGDLVAEIETDKATFELTAPVGGTLLATFFDEGALVPVFTNLFVIGESGENIDAFRPKPAAAPAAAVPVSAAAKVVVAAPLPGPGSPVVNTITTAAAAALSPRARRFAAEHDFHPATVAGTGPGGRVLEQDLRTLYFASPRLSAAAKAHVRDGSEPGREGSGVGGMILSNDLGPPATRISSIREKIARRMRESLSSTAQYTLNASAGAAGLLALRARIKAAKSGPDININDLVTYCVIQALLQMPDLNTEFIDGKLYKHSAIHIGFAVDTPRGLMVPVVQDAHRLEIGELALRMKELSAQAVQGTIPIDSLSGATFTVSNLGGLGIESFTPLLNPPQVAILGVGAIQVKPVRIEGKVAFIDAIGLSLTCDHQVIDGAPGARFLQVVREKIEKVESLCTI